MAFWIGILVAAGFAYFAIKTGFYETWAMLFNAVISIYVAIFARPVIVDTIPGTGGSPYDDALTLIVTAAGVFLILHGVSYLLLTGQFSISFPKIFDVLGSGILGFLGGLLLWSFVCLIIQITPISNNTFVKGIGLAGQFEQANTPVVQWWCNLVNSIAGRQGQQYSANQVIRELLDSAEKRRLAKEAKQAEPNEPPEPNEPEIIKPGEILGPPPEPNVVDF